MSTIPTPKFQVGQQVMVQTQYHPERNGGPHTVVEANYGMFKNIVGDISEHWAYILDSGGQHVNEQSLRPYNPQKGEYTVTFEASDMSFDDLMKSFNTNSVDNA